MAHKILVTTRLDAGRLVVACRAGKKCQPLPSTGIFGRFRLPRLTRRRRSDQRCCDFLATSFQDVTSGARPAGFSRLVSKTRVWGLDGGWTVVATALKDGQHVAIGEKACECKHCIMKT